MNGFNYHFHLVGMVIGKSKLIATICGEDFVYGVYSIIKVFQVAMNSGSDNLRMRPLPFVGRDISKGKENTKWKIPNLSPFFLKISHDNRSLEITQIKPQGPHTLLSKSKEDGFPCNVSGRLGVLSAKPQTPYEYSHV